jgi:hypothetical protein
MEFEWGKPESGESGVGIWESGTREKAGLVWDTEVTEDRSEGTDGSIW